MNDDLRLTPDEGRAREALRSLPHATADPDFRERLRAGFVSGDIAGLSAAGVSRKPATAGRSWLSGWRWALVPATAAVAIVAFIALNRGPEWQVAIIEGAGTMTVDGRPVTLTEGLLAGAVTAGSHVQLPEGVRVQLVSEDCMAIELAAGADFTVPDSPGRWFGRSVAAHLERGTARFVTMERFDGARFVVSTRELSVRIAGTSLSVECVPEGTCVCVLEGEVGIVGHDGTTATIRSGFRRVVFSDRRDPLDDAMLESEREALLELKARLAASREQHAEV